jgi:hypothetical protein
MTISSILAFIIFLIIGFLLFFPTSGFEGFQAGMPGVRCGIDLPACSFGLQCMNGFCGSPSTPPLLKNELPVYP